MGDQGIVLSSWHHLSACIKLFVKVATSCSSLWISLSFNITQVSRDSMHLASWHLLHCIMTSLQNFWMCRSFLLLMPLASPGVGLAEVLPKSMSGSKLSPSEQWSPLISGGIPNERIQAAVRASARTVVLAIILMVALPLWWVAGLVVPRYRWWWRSIKPLLVKSHVMCKCRSSTSSFISMPKRISFPAACHVLIWAIRLVIIWLHGLGHCMPCSCSKQVCCAVMVLDVASNFCVHTQYVEIRMMHLLFCLTSSSWDQCPRYLSWPLSITLLAHFQRARIIVPPGWYLSSLFLVLEDVDSFLWLNTLLHWMCSSFRVVGVQAVFISWAMKILASIVFNSMMITIMSCGLPLSHWHWFWTTSNFNRLN